MNEFDKFTDGQMLIELERRRKERESESFMKAIEIKDLLRAKGYDILAIMGVPVNPEDPHMKADSVKNIGPVMAAYALIHITPQKLAGSLRQWSKDPKWEEKSE